jgi:hypothetical protein
VQVAQYNRKGSEVSKEAKERRIALMVEPSLADRIDSYRFVRRIGSRAEAMRRLINEALATAETKTATTEPARAE